MRVFCHHLYEYKKGVRRMILHTMHRRHFLKVVQKLNANSITYKIVHLSEAKFNVFFGDENCIEVASSFVDKPLNELSDKEDFILGVLLGYDIKEQCKRYIERSEQKEVALEA